MRRPVRHMLREEGGNSAAEFAIVLPLLLMLLLGIIDVGRLMWTWNRAEKATQMGVRYAVSTDVVPTGLVNYDFATTGGILQGSPIPQSAFGGAACTSASGTASCSCNSGATCPALTPINQTAFTNIVNRMKLFMPEITAGNVEVDYDYSGLGYAGDPDTSKPQVAPLIRVSLKSMTFNPITLELFKTSISLPSFSAALTMEDGQGNVAN